MSTAIASDPIATARRDYRVIDVDDFAATFSDLRPGRTAPMRIGWPTLRAAAAQDDAWAAAVYAELLDMAEAEVLGRRYRQEARRRQQMAECPGHRAVTTSGALPYFYAVAVEPYTAENRRAHGGARYIETCACGATREFLSNGGHVEYAPWSEVGHVGKTRKVKQ